MLVKNGFRLAEINAMTEPELESYLDAVVQLAGGKSRPTETRRYVSQRKKRR